jgi:hypothetical protein
MTHPEGAFREALRRGSDFFMKRGNVYETMNRLTRRLDEEHIPYAVIGGMALAAHGFERFTSDVDLLTTPEGLTRIHERLVGRGYVPAFQGARKALRDTTSNVQVEFITTGEFPGDGKPKPVQFPDPALVAVERDGYSVIDLPNLIELKLASGLSAARREKDLVDVRGLIERLKLPRELGAQLDASVRDAFYQMWEDEQNATGPDRE